MCNLKTKCPHCKKQTPVVGHRSPARLLSSRLTATTAIEYFNSVGIRRVSRVVELLAALPPKLRKGGSYERRPTTRC